MGILIPGQEPNGFESLSIKNLKKIKLYQKNDFKRLDDFYLKKICWISPYPPNKTPIGKITYMLIKGLLNKKKFDISLITFKEKSILRDLPIKIYPILKKESISAIIQSLPIIKKANFDIIHIMSTRFLNGRLFLIITFLLKNLLRVKSKIIISVHEFYEFSNLKELFIGGLYHIFLLRYADLLLVFNKGYRNAIASKFIYKKKKENIRFISRNVQSMRYENIKPSKIWLKKDISPFILFFGFLRPLKGLPFLVKALKLVEQEFPDLNLIVAGGISSGPASKNYFLKVEKLISQLNLKQKVIFTDFISENEVMELFNLAELVVYPYLNIEQSGALFAALFAGKAIIATDIPGFRAILSNEKNCLLVKPKSSSDIAQAITKTLKNYSLRRKIEEGVKKTYKDNSFDKLINKYYNYFLKFEIN